MNAELEPETPAEAAADLMTWIRESVEKGEVCWTNVRLAIHNKIKQQIELDQVAKRMIQGE